MTHDESFYASLMRHEVPKPHRQKAKWPIRTTPPRCDDCRNEPPACTCVRSPKE